ncbi:MAG: flagellar basal body P-ring protein FlgI [Proteobacteria bacterium]|nr:flagellar basal body P-ring protein FlgI [Pseudomonadota bacterium]MCP4921724.1 flagellar basal body P-ring protein FlgI [Pseudomonadota bacterium]
MLLSLWSPPVHAEVRAKDVGRFLGMQDMYVSGIGVVTGLSRTGDSTKNMAAAEALLQQAKVQGYTTEALVSRNVALVRVTAKIAPDAREGAPLDITVSSLGDATSLVGGQLGMTILATDMGEAVATGRGALTVGGYSQGGGGDSSSKNHTTVAYIADGGTLMMDLPGVDFSDQPQVEFILAESDWTTVARLADGINAEFEQPIATAVSSSTIEIVVPEDYTGRFPWFAAQVESVPVHMDTPARVVVNERTGTVVMGAGVRIQDVAIAHGGLTIEVDNRVEAVQAAPLTLGTTTLVQNGAIEVRETDGQLEVVGGTSIGDLVSALNSMGVKPRDLITILQMIEAAGALHAEIEVR